jgi:hypothetical protein
VSSKLVLLIRKLPMKAGAVTEELNRILKELKRVSWCTVQKASSGIHEIHNNVRTKEPVRGL